MRVAGEHLEAQQRHACRIARVGQRPRRRDPRVGFGVGEQVRQLDHRVAVAHLHQRHRARAAQRGRRIDLPTPHRLHLHVMDALQKNVFGGAFQTRKRVDNRGFRPAAGIGLGGDCA